MAAAETYKKTPGVTKVVALMALDTNHNGIAYETAFRAIFASKKDWRLIFVRASKAFTPDLIADADLFMAARTGIEDPIDLFPDPVSDTGGPGEPFWTDANTAAVVRNISERGMGFLSLHCTLYSRRQEILDVLGVEPIMHRQVQPLWVRDCNQDHPITRGIGRFMINLDEQFGAMIKSEYTATLFETTAMHDKRECVGGWAREHGKGRVVALLPGHTSDPYLVPEYREILWRSAHWAVRQDIPAYPKS